jgi:two-component system sensor histidine kinase UhpB
LINALISLCARVENESSLRVRRALEGPIPDLPRDVELAVYRIAQEALTNVMRHSGASEVDVALACTDDQLMLSVTDNGRGLPEDVREGGGLTGMRERAMLIGASLDVSSNGGVSVTLRLPLKREDPCPPR